MTRMQTCSPALSRTRLLGVWTFSCPETLSRRIVKKYVRFLTLLITSGTSGWEEASFFLGKLSCYAAERSSPLSPRSQPSQHPTQGRFHPSPRRCCSGREGGGGCRRHGRKPCLFLAETTTLIRQNNANGAEEALIMQKGWMRRAVFFAIGCNLRSSSAGKSLPPPTLPLFSPFQMPSAALQTHFTACLPHLTGSIAFLFPSPTSETAQLAR